MTFFSAYSTFLKYVLVELFEKLLIERGKYLGGKW